MFIIVAYMNHVYNTHLKTIYVMVNLCSYRSFFHFTSSMESEVTFVSIPASSNVFALTHILQLTDWKKISKQPM